MGMPISSKCLGGKTSRHPETGRRTLQEGMVYSRLPDASLVRNKSDSVAQSLVSFHPLGQ